MNQQHNQQKPILVQDLQKIDNTYELDSLKDLALKNKIMKSMHLKDPMNDLSQLG